MDLLIYIIMFAVVLSVIIFLIVLLAARKIRDTGAGKYEIFDILDNRFVVLAGIPVTYDIDTIASITFSLAKVRRSSSYVGNMRIIKKNGQKSRAFIFDSSAYTKKFALANTRQDIEDTIQYLMDELKSYHLPCTFLD